MNRFARSFTAAVFAALLLGLSAGMNVAAAQAIGSAELELLGPKTSWSMLDRKIDAGLRLASRAFVAAQARGSQIPATTPNIEAFIAEAVAADQTTFVVIKGTVTDDLLGTLAGVGATEVSPFPQYDTVTARVPITAVPDLAAQPDVRRIGPREGYQTHRYEPSPEESRARLRGLQDFISNAGAANWQGVTAHQADKAHQTGIDGTGVKVCVLSDGINTLATRQASGDLPPVVQVLAGQAGSGDEGTAMLEIVHDMAPGAALAFASAFPSQAQFATNILGLRNTLACDIIVDDVTYFAEGVFQDDNVAQAVTTVTNAGALFFSSAANSGNLTHATSGTFEGDFVASGVAIPAAITAAEGGAIVQAHAFGANNYTTLTKATTRVSLKWSDPLATSGNDYDLFVMDSTGTNIISSSVAIQDGNDNPFEFASGSFPIGARIYLIKFSGVQRALHLDTIRGAITVANSTTGSTSGHNAAASALTVAAVALGLAGGNAFTGGAGNPVETYSSDGPRRMFYNPNGTAITAGNILFGTNGGTLLPKVDLAAGDCGTTTTPGFIPFCGTSAAAPAAAAIAALIKSAKPTATKAQITTALLNSALDIEAAGTDRDSGVGIVMAPAAVRAVLTALGVSKAFVAASIPVNTSSQLRISITNSNTVDLDGVAFTDTYPSPNVKNAAVPATGISGAGCAGTLTAAAGAGSFALTAGTIPAGITCIFSVSVTATVGGSYVFNSGAVTTPIALNTAAASATLTVTGGGVTAPVIVSAVSRKVHGLAGTFDLPLSLVPTNPATEPRQGPTQVTVVTFDKSLSGGTVSVPGGLACTPVLVGAAVTLTCTTVADQQYVAYTFSGISSTDGGTGGSGVVRVGYLKGDVNATRSVSVGDVALVNAVLAQGVNGTNFLRDVNVSGTLSVADKAVVNANLAKSLPPP